MIRFDNVVKTYRLQGQKKVILKGLTLELPRRNIAIMGANGAGKSTLLRLISGAELPTSGIIRRAGHISWPLGFTGGFNGSLSGLENSRFVARIFGQDTEAVVAFVEEFSELGASIHMPVRTYSSGMRARLAFGLSMAIRFDCYLIDEITAVGDARFKTKARATFLSRLAHSRIIMVSHSMSTLKRYCDMGIVLRDGQVYVFDDLADAIAFHQRFMSVQGSDVADGDEL